MESFPQPAFGRVKVESASHQLQLSLECHSCSSGDFAQNVTQYRQFASPTHNPTRRVLAANAEFGFHTMSVDVWRFLR